MRSFYSGEILSTLGNLSLSETSPPQSFIEPLTLTEVRKYLRLPEISPSDPAEDDELTGFIVGAREQAEILQRQDLVRKQYDLHFDYWPDWRISLRAPLVSVDLVQYRDSDGTIVPLTENTHYIIDTFKRPGFITPAYNATWPSFTPWPSSALLIRFTSGYTANSAFWADAGARLKIGMKLLISQWYEQRLPFEKGSGAVQEYGYAITSCLSYGAVPGVF